MPILPSKLKHSVLGSVLGDRSGSSSVHELNRPYVKGDLEGIMRGQCFLHVHVLPTPIKFFLPCDVMYAIS